MMHKIEKYKNRTIEGTEKRREQARLRLAKWRKDNPEKYSAQVSAWISKNRDKININAKQWNKNNPAQYLFNAQKARLKKFGITPEHLLETFFTQNWSCAICSRTPIEMNKKFHADHNHKTNEFRGVLCPDCNHLIGLAGDNPVILAKAIQYIQGRDFNR